MRQQKKKLFADHTDKKAGSGNECAIYFITLQPINESYI